MPTWAGNGKSFSISARKVAWERKLTSGRGGGMFHAMELELEASSFLSTGSLYEVARSQELSIDHYEGP